MKYFCAFFFWSVIVAFVGCAVHRQTEDFKIQSIDNLFLTAETHPHGFAKSECFACHLPQNIHQEDRLHSPNFNLAAPMVEANGLSSCIGCHGNNGVSQ